MHITKLIPIDSILKDIYMLLRESDIQEDLVMEFAIRAMEHMASYRAYEKAVCFVRIENSQGMYPPGMLGIWGVQYNTKPTVGDFKQYVTTHEDANSDDELPKEERVQGYLDPNRNVIHWKVQDFMPVATPKDSGWKYLPMSDNAWDRSILCNQEFVGTTCNDWYIPDSSNSRFITSFDTGWLAVSYFRFPMNKKGQFLIPDIAEYTEAIESYVLSKIYQRLWHYSVQGAQSKYTHYLNKWQWLCGAAVSRMTMLSLPEWMNVDKQNRFFKDDSPLKVYGGYGRESMHFNKSPYGGRQFNR